MNKIKDFLLKLGISNEETAIYLILSQRGILTPLEIARATSINRTKVYRLLERMKEKGLVEEIIDVFRKKAKAAGIEHLALLVKEQEEKAAFLTTQLPTISNLLRGNTSLSQPGTKVLFYRGKEGIRQQIWNTLRTKEEAVGYTYRPVAELIGDYYYEWRNEWIKRKLFFRDIINPDYLLYKKGVTDSLTHPADSFATRIIPPKILLINHQIDIYNEVVSYYNWYEGEIFGVEIYNQKIAIMQKQLFEIVWKLAKKS